MDKSIIRDFAKLRVLTPCDFQRMDELVQDLSRALEESSKHGGSAAASSSKQRKRRGRKRRAPKLSMLFAQCSLTPPDPFLLPSEDSASSVDETQLQSARQPAAIATASIHLPGLQTDSDDVSSSGRLGALCRDQMIASHLPVASFAESDSVNENFSPVRPHRRKRKFKRMAVDPTLAEVVLGSSPSHQGKPHRRKCKNGEEANPYRWREADLAVSPVFPGKRKHSMRERSVELLEGESCTLAHGPNTPHHQGSLGMGGTSGALRYGLPRGGLGRMPVELSGFSPCQENRMELGEEAFYLANIESSSSLSSSESDAGIYTNDEGREGDDEHSDFYHEAGPSCGIPGEIPHSWWESVRSNDNQGSIVDSATFQSILSGNFPHMSYEAQQAFCARVCRLTTVPGREIRAGRRRLRDRRPGFSIVSSMNEKISKFLQDPEQNELRLHHMRKTEMDQLRHLASLYSLSMSDEGVKHNRCPVLTKTRNTTQAISVDKVGVTNLWNLTAVSDIKRRRRTPPTSPEVQGYVSEQAELIPENNTENQMLLSVGFEPSTSPAEDSTNIRTPIMTFLRPKSQAFGFGISSNSKPS